MRIDAHQHFWQLNRGDYHWISAQLQPLNRDFLPEHLAPLLAAAGVDKTILVQAAETSAETDFILSLSETHDMIAGVVGWVDMDAGNVRDELKQRAEHPNFLGIRPVMQDMSDTQWMLQKKLDACYQWLIDNNKTFDALIKPRHLDTLATLLKRYPELPVVIDHGAKPDIGNHQFQPWADKMSAVAQYRNAHCKLSGLVTEADGKISPLELEPYMNHLLTCFGAERLMWGSDWPVINLACDYNQWLHISQQFITQLTKQQQDAIMGGTAQRFYKLDA